MKTFVKITSVLPVALLLSSCGTVVKAQWQSDLGTPAEKLPAE